jgi:hypothetical protein
MSMASNNFTHSYVDNAHAGIDLVSGFILLNVNAKDRVASMLQPDTAAPNSSLFSGFLYSPKPSVTQAVAFSVVVDAYISIPAPTDPIPYNYVFVNQPANVFDTVTKRFVTPQGGVYYVHVSIMSNGSTNVYGESAAKRCTNNGPEGNEYWSQLPLPNQSR